MGARDELAVVRREVNACFACRDRSGFHDLYFVHRFGNVYRDSQDILLLGERPGIASKKVGESVDDERYEELKSQRDWGAFIEELGLDWTRVYNTNLVKCAGWEEVNGRKRDRKSRSEEIENCMGFLNKQLQIMGNLKVVIACGEPPVCRFVRRRINFFRDTGTIEDSGRYKVIICPNPTGTFYKVNKIKHQFIPRVRAALDELVRARFIEPFG